MLLLPLVGLVAVAAVLGLSMGRKAALTTESEVIEAVAARYLDEGGSARRDCRARPAVSEGLWLVVTCSRAGVGFEYFIDRFGRVADRSVLEGES
jgi:hypothetical protein